MKPLLAALVFSFCFTTPVLAATAPQDWFNVNPKISACQKSPITPRQFDSGMRERGEASDMVVHRSEINQAILGVDVTFMVDGQHKSVTFYTSQALCEFALLIEIQQGNILPPDVK